MWKRFQTLRGSAGWFIDDGRGERTGNRSSPRFSWISIVQFDWSRLRNELEFVKLRNARNVDTRVLHGDSLLFGE